MDGAGVNRSIWQRRLLLREVRPDIALPRPGTESARTLHRLLAEQEIFFESVWQRLTLAQRAVLRAVVLDHGHEILGADARTRYRLGGASSVQTSLLALQRLDLIAREDDGRYSVVDSLMREWVARKTY